jgi:sugar lactone lactonase YvrE
MVLTTIAGKAGIWGSSDGAGAAALFYYPRGIATDGANLYVADSSNHTIRKIAISTGEVTTLAGSAGASGSSDGVGTAARFYYPCGITTDGANLYVADTSNHTIRKIGISTGFVTTLAGTEEISGYRDGAGTLARFFFPYGITTDGADLYVADSSNHTIRKIAISTGVVTTFAGTADVPGNSNGTGQMARFCYPRGIETDGTNLYVADTGNHTIRRIAISTREVTTLAGSAGYEGSDDGTGDTARFYFPSGVTTDGAKIYVADTYNHKIRTITR